MWECLNATWNALPERQRYARWVGPHAFFSLRRGPRGHVLRAWPPPPMSRDDSWRFYLLGRSVERVDMIVRLLLSRVWTGCRAPAGSPCCAATGAARHLPAHLPRRAGRDPGGAVPADGQAVPALGVPRAAPGRDPAWPSWTNRPSSRIGSKAEALRLLGRARSELEFLRPGRSCSTTCRPSCWALQE